MAKIDLTPLGFAKDTCCSLKANRWELKDDKQHRRYASVTLDDDSEKILYAFVQWEHMDTRDLLEKRKIKSDMPIETLLKVLDINTPETELPENVVVYPLNTSVRWNRLNKAEKYDNM